MEADQDRDGKISFGEFTKMVENTDVSMSMTLGKSSNTLITSILNLTSSTAPILHILRLLSTSAKTKFSTLDQF